MRPIATFWCAAASLPLACHRRRAGAGLSEQAGAPSSRPAAAGNSPDVVTRIVADRLTQLWKQQVVVINRPGAGGLIAAQAAAATAEGRLLDLHDAGLDLHGSADPAGRQDAGRSAQGLHAGRHGRRAADRRRRQQGRQGQQRRRADQARQRHEGRHAVCRHQPRRPVASDRRTVPRPRQGEHLVRARRRRRGVGQRRHRRPHPDHVRRPRRPGAGNAGRRHPAAGRRLGRSGCPTCRTCRRSTRPCRAWFRAAGS